MTNLEFARWQMAFSLGCHIVFASISMVMPFLMFLAYRNHLRRGDELDLRLAKAWMKGTAILFATGAVTGTALSFQLGLLWPRFMQHAGPIFGMPFALEGAAFFLEAIFLGLFLYGWDRLRPRLHLFFGFMVGVCGVASGVLVVAANGWMNAPSGFRWVDGHAVDIDPWAAMFNQAWPPQALHMTVAAFQATTVAAAGLHALGILRRRGELLHRRALHYLLPLVAVSSIAQPIVGDWSAKSVAQRQPEKLAAMEAHFHTRRHAPLLIGGWPDAQQGSVTAGIFVPGGLSFLAFGDPEAEVLGLNAFPEDERPPVVVTHVAFQLMVGLGALLLLVGLVHVVARLLRLDLLRHRWWLVLLVAVSPAGFVALEAGWTVTEVGRQPWIVYRVLRTSETVTPVTGLGWVLGLNVVLYMGLGVLSFYLLSRWFVLESKRG